MVIGTFALLFFFVYFFVNFDVNRAAAPKGTKGDFKTMSTIASATKGVMCYQGSGPGGDRRGS